MPNRLLVTSLLTTLQLPPPHAAGSHRSNQSARKRDGEVADNNAGSDGSPRFAGGGADDRMRGLPHFVTVLDYIARDRRLYAFRFDALPWLAWALERPQPVPRGCFLAAKGGVLHDPA